MSPGTQPKIVDADLFIQDRIRRGEHIVIRTVYGTQLLHPGCGLPCEYSDRTPTEPTDEQPLYVARLEGDQIIPDPHVNVDVEEGAATT